MRDTKYYQMLSLLTSHVNIGILNRIPLVSSRCQIHIRYLTIQQSIGDQNILNKPQFSQVCYLFSKSSVTIIAKRKAGSQFRYICTCFWCIYLHVFHLYLCSIVRCRKYILVCDKNTISQSHYWCGMTWWKTRNTRELES